MKWKAVIILSFTTGLLGYLSGGYFSGGFDDTQNKDSLQALEPVVEQRITERYICPMHSAIITGSPGSCPICGMELIPLETEVGDDGGLFQPALRR